MTLIACLELPLPTTGCACEADQRGIKWRSGNNFIEPPKSGEKSDRPGGLSGLVVWV